MRHGAFLKTCLLCVSVVMLGCAGCAHTFSSESTQIRQAMWQAGLDDCRDVRLSVVRVSDRDAGQSERMYERLVLEVRPRASLESETVLKSIELKPGARSGEFDFEGIDVRADESKTRVWFIDRESGRVIATLDRETGLTTGPDDEPPSWATADGGVPLGEPE